jgi:predicted DNA binding protein/FixJ family two-component response regulator
MTESPIDVLLVDDNVEWADATSIALEEADDRLSVLVATSGWEALDLLDDEEFDCVVCDYRMPDFDGLALLERIRADHGDLPFILITGSGNEVVASRAISSSVTDYFIKEPARDQSQVLSMRVASAVDAYWTERALEAARRRFTGLFENVPDPVAVVAPDGELRAANGAFESVFATDDPDVVGAPLTDVVEAIEETTEVAEVDGVSVERLTAETADGRRAFLVRRIPLEPADGTEFGYVFTDVTHQRERERELERFYDHAEEVRELLLSAETRTELEERFCETVVSSTAATHAWVGRTNDDGTVDVRAAVGGTADELEPTTPDGVAAVDTERTTEEPFHPVCEALSTREPVYTRDVTDRSEQWATRTRAAGIRCLLAVPFERHGVPAGVFVTGAPDPGAFDGARDRLEALVSSLGDAIEFVERSAALTADQVVRVRLSVGDDGTLLNELSDAVDTEFDVVSAVPEGETGATLYAELPGDDAEAALEWLDGASAVEEASLVSEGQQARVRLTVTEPTSLTRVARQATAVRSAHVVDGTTTVQFDVPLSGDVRRVVSAVEEAYDDVVVQALRDVNRQQESDGRPLSRLTDKQRRALQTAYNEGYFERPRARSAEEVADVLGVSGTTFLQHLRVAERKLLAEFFEWSAGTESR